MCITATNEHAIEDAEFQKKVGGIETNENRRRAFLKDILRFAIPLLGYHQRELAWSTDTFKEQKEVKKIMSFRQYSLLNSILDGGGGKFAPPAGFLNIAQKPLGLGS